jgi:hypothetical protein
MASVIEVNEGGLIFLHMFRGLFDRRISPTSQYCHYFGPNASYLIFVMSSIANGDAYCSGRPQNKRALSSRRAMEVED